MKEFTIEEIQQLGVQYEPDSTKCKAYKIHLFPSDDCNVEFLKRIQELNPYEYVHQIKETLNPYSNSPEFFSDPKIIIIGHTPSKNKI